MTDILQFEIDRKRAKNFTNSRWGDSSIQHIHLLGQMALIDTINNYGTFVVVSSHDKITITQRADITELDK